MSQTMHDVRNLIESLRRHGITLTADVDRVLALHKAITAPDAHDLPAPDLTTATADDVLDWVRHAAFTQENRDALVNRAWMLEGQIASTLTGLLTNDVEAILDQLRPDFTTAAVAVHDTVTAGIRPNHTADDVISLGARAINMWQKLGPQVTILEDIADIRIALTDVLNVAPVKVLWLTDRPYAACFTTSDAPWVDRNDRWLSARWLRLTIANDGPLALLPLEQTQAAASRQDWDNNPGPLVVENTLTRDDSRAEYIATR